MSKTISLTNQKGITAIEDAHFTHQLLARNPMTYIKGIAGGKDVKPGDPVTITIGNETISTQLDGNKTFSVPVKTVLLANDAQRLEKRKLQVLNIKMVLPLMSTISKLFETHSN
ncbi:hypothetical protein Q7458_10095 [Glaesserella parasuis]|uniref:hypothetical protein n=1 Tax=Glaesserella parasuis TaxID=738 RepID=UPI0008FCC362|nr:hypothetical protein [Glaesserella parasuis]MDO9765545.1 hypothetical protein [Glaesserella parasuis]MDO9799042.1 hypothetical protein [Glaesserella parasuis]MDO9850956.1 hypothetical protein [Glaesserella parasuis]MDO9858551.1 hypothetical protein [Glaesserella parasuis]MDO9865244.1 hypothetical protein [Glaesserella parasuis]